MELSPYQSQPPCRGGRASADDSFIGDQELTTTYYFSCAMQLAVLEYLTEKLFGRDELFDMIVLPLVYLLMIKLNEEPTILSSLPALRSTARLSSVFLFLIINQI